jgi:DNA-binding IclR family transcriptional regulator
VSQAPTKRSPRPGTTLQTLRRGLEALSLISEHPNGLSVAEIAERMEIDRAIAYRIVGTLELDGFVCRAPNGHIHLGGAILTLASGLEPQLRAFAAPALHKLAQEASATAFLSVARGNEAVALLVAEAEAGPIRVSYRVGSRHPLDRGAAGIAILAGRPASRHDSDAVRDARSNGYSVTRGELQRGAVGVAAPVRFSPRNGLALEASVGVVALDDLDVGRATPLVVASAAEISRFFHG